jgi:oligopeptide transport system ATP-binding protein
MCRDIKSDVGSISREAGKMDAITLLEVENLTKYFPIVKGLLKKTVGYVKAVDGISFQLKKGETLGLVGESGCGKSTLGRSILRLIEPTSGRVIMQDSDVLSLNKAEMRKERQKLQIIFQDPFTSLNPRMTVGDIIEEPLKVHKKGTPDERQNRVLNLLRLVGLSEESIGRYPHQFSGGQRQRIGIARALALDPKLIVCDEPVSALDVSVRSQILNLLNELKQKLGLTLLFISHDLSVVKHVSDRVAVMYLGRIVELADKDELYDNPLHPYTKALMSAIPVPDPLIRRERIILRGDVPSPVNPPAGCHFSLRCYCAEGKCMKEKPVLVDYGNAHHVACHMIGVKKERT